MTDDDRTDDDLTGDDRTGRTPDHRAGGPGDDAIDALLRSARGGTAPIGAELRARILADAPAPSPAPRSGVSPGRWLGRWLGGLVAMPGAVLLGLWVGLAQPSVVLGLIPQAAGMDGGTTLTEAEDPAAGQTSAETALLGDIFGTTWATATLEDTE